MGGGRRAADINLENDYEAFQLFFAIREALVNFLAENELTQSDLAELMGVTGSWVGQCLSGHQHTMGRGVTMNLLTVAKLTDAVGMRLAVTLVPIPEPAKATTSDANNKSLPQPAPS